MPPSLFILIPPTAAPITMAQILLTLPKTTLQHQYGPKTFAPSTIPIVTPFIPVTPILSPIVHFLHTRYAQDQPHILTLTTLRPRLHLVTTFTPCITFHVLPSILTLLAPLLFIAPFTLYIPSIPALFPTVPPPL